METKQSRRTLIKNLALGASALAITPVSALASYKMPENKSKKEMKYLIVLLFCSSCVKTNDYQKMVDKTTNFVRFNEKIAKVHILREKTSQYIQNGKYHDFLTENQLLNQKETFCTLAIQKGKKAGVTRVFLSFCSGNNYTYYFSDGNVLDSMDVNQTKRHPNKLDSLCNEKWKKNHPKIINKANEMSVPPPPIKNGIQSNRQ